MAYASVFGKGAGTSTRAQTGMGASALDRPRLPSLGGVTAAKELGGGLSGLARLIMPGKKAGEGSWKEAGKGVLSSLAGSAPVILGAVGGAIGSIVPGAGTAAGAAAGAGLGALLSDPIVNLYDDQVESMLGEGYRPRSFSDKVMERGVLPAIIEDVGNASLVGSAISAPARVGRAAAMGTSRTGRVAGRLTGQAPDVTRAAELSAKIKRLEPVTHPYRTASRELVRPALSGARESYLTAAGGAARATEPAPVTATEAARAAQRAETMAATAEKRAAKLRDSAAGDPTHERLLELAARASQQAQTRRIAADEAMTGAAEKWDQPVHARDAYGADGALLAGATPAGVGNAAGQTAMKSKFLGRLREARDGIRPVEGAPQLALRTRLGAVAAGWMDTTDMMRETTLQRRQMEASRRQMLRSDAVVSATEAARRFLVDRHPEMDPMQASEIVGDEVYARLSGIHQLAEDVLGPRGHEMLTAEGVFGTGSPRTALAPDDLRGTPEWEAAIEDVTQKMREEHARATDMLMGSRLAEQGLEKAGIDGLDLLPAQQRQLAAAARERLQAQKLEGKVRTQRDIQEGRVVAAEDRIGRMAAEGERLLQKREGSLAAFDETRQYIAPAFGKGQRAATYAAVIARTRASWNENGQQFGGATFNPHTGALFDPHTGPQGRFLEAGDQAYAIGVVNDTAVKVHIDQLAPDHIDQLVRAFQDLYENPEIMIGTWVDSEGNVHIDPSQVVTDRDRALTLAAARGQEAIWDNGSMDEIKPYLSDRPDVAARFVADDTWRRRQAGALRAAADSDRHNITHGDVDKMLALTDLMATTAWNKHGWTHPDQWYRQTRYELRRGRKYLRKGVVEQTLNQTYLKRDYTEELWNDVTDFLGPEQLDEAMAWYRRSHQWVKDTFAGAPPVRLLDGSTRAADDLFFQVLAVTSVQASPTTNLGNALKATANINRFMDLPEFKAQRQRYATVLKRAAKEGWTREEIMTRLFPEGMAETASKARKKTILESELGTPIAGRAEGTTAAMAAAAKGDVYRGMEGLNTHMYDFAKTLVFEILSGNTIDKWNAGTLNQMTRAWTGKDKLTATQFAKLTESFGGNDVAAMEHFGGQMWAKLRSFHDNLSNPEGSDLATLDSWMARLLDLENWDSPGTYAAYAEKLRDLAVYAGRPRDEGGLGRVVKPHEIQAALWAFSKLQIGRQNWGRLMGFTKSALEDINAGRWGPDGDPIAAYFEEDLAGSARARQRLAGVPEEALEEIEGEGAAAGKGFEVEPRTIRRADVRPEEIPKDRAAKDDLKRRIMEEEGVAGSQGRLISDDTLRRWVDKRFRRQLAEAEVGEETQYVAHETRLEGKIMQDEAGNWVPAPAKVPAGANLKSVLKAEKQYAGYQRTQREIATALERGDTPSAVAVLMKWVNLQRKTLLDENWGDFNEIAANEGAADLQFAKTQVPALAGEAAPTAKKPLTIGGGEGLMQMFEREVALGQMIPTETHYIIRLFRDADFTTLAHENAHVLRQMLPEHQVKLIEKAYGVSNAAWAVEHEERFAEDFVTWMAGGGRVGALVRNPALGEVFTRVQQVLAEYWPQAQNLIAGEAAPATARLFDEWLSPTKVARPAGIIGVEVPVRPEMTGARVATPEELGSRAPGVPLGTPAEAFRRGARGQKALRQMEKAQARLNQVETAKARVEKSVEEMRTQLDEHMLPAEVAQRTLREKAQRRLEKLDLGTDHPTRSQVPRAWAPLWDAVENIRKAIDEKPELVGLLEGDVPQTFGEVLRYAMDRGLQPQHVRDFKPAQVQRLVFQGLRLGRPALGDIGEEITAGTRKRSYGTLRRAGEADRSVEALVAGTVEALHEKHTNNLVTWIESNAARKIPEGGRVPPGWAVWDPQRAILLSGKEAAGGTVQAERGAQFMIPKPMAQQLRRMTKDYSHWSLEFFGKVMQPWRAFVLTLNPRYYTNNLIGNFVLATAEGVRVADWRKAWEAYRGETVAGKRVRYRNVPVGGDVAVEVAGLAGPQSTLVPSGGRMGTTKGAGAWRNTRAALASINRINEAGDSFARAAVYFATERKGRAAGVPEGQLADQALTRAYEALVDYNSLSPFERQAIRQVIPFYSWQKGILKIAMRQPWDHPGRTALLMSLSQFNDDAAADMLGLSDPSQVPEDYKHLMLGVPGVGNLNIKSMNPFADAYKLMTPEGVTGSMNFIIEAMLRDGLGAPEGGFAKSYRMNTYGAAEPDVDAAGDIAYGMVGGLPPVQAAASVAGMESLGGRPVGTTAAARWAGLPVMSDEQVARAQARIQKTLARQRGQRVPKSEEGGQARRGAKPYASVFGGG